uniref:Uncharacterized protein LOC109678506 n=1 Tax=Castor canadensis TaxID=51338 RepID=A0A8B7TWA2_CASCN
MWQTLVEDPPSWLQPFIHESPADWPMILAMLGNIPIPITSPKKPILQEEWILHPSLIDLDFEVNPLPYAAAAPLQPEAADPSEPPHLSAFLSAPPVSGPVRRLTPGRQQEETPEEEPSSTSTGAPILLVRALGGASPNVGCTYQYWPFSSSDLYNWKAQNPPFSEDLRGLTDLFESILHTHSPTWDDCQQLLKTLFTTEEQERILTEARKNVPGDNGRPTTLPNLIDDRFPLNRPDWDYGDAEGKERLRVYCQTLMAGLRVAARHPTNLAKVKAIMQGENESPAVLLEHLYNAYRQYTPLDPLAQVNQSAMIMSFINQAAPDIRKKLYKQEGLGEMTIRDL